jgi:hypothetical protein
MSKVATTEPAAVAPSATPPTEDKPSAFVAFLGLHFAPGKLSPLLAGTPAALALAQLCKGSRDHVLEHNFSRYMLTPADAKQLDALFVLDASDDTITLCVPTSASQRARRAAAMYVGLARGRPIRLDWRVHKGHSRTLQSTMQITGALERTSTLRALAFSIEGGEEGGQQEYRWAPQLRAKLREFDVDQDGVLNGAELHQFILEALVSQDPEHYGSARQSEEEKARDIAEYFMHKADEANPRFLAGDGMRIGGLVNFYRCAAIGRATSVRHDLRVMRVELTAARHEGAVGQAAVTTHEGSSARQIAGWCLGCGKIENSGKFQCAHRGCSFRGSFCAVFEHEQTCQRGEASVGDTARIASEVAEGNTRLFTAILRHSRHFRRLDLSGFGLDTAKAAQVAAALTASVAGVAGFCRGFETLDLSRNPLGLDGALIAAGLLQHSRTLATLDLAETNLTTNGAQSAQAPGSYGTQVAVTHDSGITCLTEALKANKNVTCLRLRRNCLQADAAAIIGKALSQFPALQTLDLSSCSICEHTNANRLATQKQLTHRLLDLRGLTAITFSLLTSTTRLLDLDLSRNDLRDEGARLLGQVLQRSRLRSLTLSGNNLSRGDPKLAANCEYSGRGGDSNFYTDWTGLASIFRSLARNTCLEHLDISMNAAAHTGLPEGIPCGQELACALQENTALTSLNVRGTGFGSAASVLVGKALLVSVTGRLQYLTCDEWDLGGNAVPPVTRLDATGVGSGALTLLAGVLRANSTLLALKVSGISESDCSLLKAVSVNSTLTELDVSNVQLTAGERFPLPALLASVTENFGLRALIAKDNKLTAADAHVIASAMQSRQLGVVESLDLSCNFLGATARWLDDFSGVEALLAALVAAAVTGGPMHTIWFGQNMIPVDQISEAGYGGAVVLQATEGEAGAMHLAAITTAKAAYV